jgi:hypothetical protein
VDAESEASQHHLNVVELAVKDLREEDKSKYYFIFFTFN